MGTEGLGKQVIKYEKEGEEKKEKELKGAFIAWVLKK